MKNIGKRIKESRKAAGLSCAEIAKMLDVSPQSVYGWEAGAVPKPDRLERLAEILAVPLRWLVYGDGECRSYRANGDGIVIPMLDVNASAGSGVVNYDAAVITLMTIKESWVREHAGTVQSTLRIFFVRGDSMVPTLSNGDCILVDESVSNISSDGIYVVSFDEQVYVKRFQRIPGRRLRMLSDNADRYPPIDLDPDKIHDFRVHGHVLHSWHGTPHA